MNGSSDYCFLHSLKDEKKNFHIQFFDLLEKNEDQISLLLDLKGEELEAFLAQYSGIQESFRVRSERRAMLIADALLTEEGEIDKKKLNALIKIFKKTPNIINYDEKSDRIIDAKIVIFLNKLKNERSLTRKLYQFSIPLPYLFAENLVKNSLGITFDKTLTNRDLRCAVLSSCFTILRQNVGSCFATAPAILIHEEQTDTYLDDLYQLLTTGRLKRIFGGQEYAVPISPTWGEADINRRFDLRSDFRPIFSPGLIKAFEKIEMIDPKSKLEDKISFLKQAIERSDLVAEVVSSDQILRTLLLQHHQIEEKDYSAFIKSQEKEKVRSGEISFTSSNQQMLKFQHVVDLEKIAQSTFKRVTDHPLLKTWEYSLASFAEFKTDFSRWNLYTSLGFDPKEPGGLGGILYRGIDSKLQEHNEKAEEFHNDAEHALSKVKMVETLLRNATSKDQLRRLKAEHQLYNYQLTTAIDMRDQHHKFAKHYSEFFSYIIERYHNLFPIYFQEIYDAEMHDVVNDIYDDSPAGFRLVYKHGRRDPSLWTLIYNQEQYIDVLIEFFKITESLISSEFEEDFQQSEFSEIVTEIIYHIQTEIFIKSAFTRMTKAHKELPSLQQGIKKPWAYISGGSMNHLLKSYFKRETDMTEETLVAEEPLQFLVSLIELFKEMPYQTSSLFEDDARRGMLMNSPTHAFALQPGYQFFMKAWQDRGFTYTWVRDQLVNSALQFYHSLSLSYRDQEFLIDRFSENLPAVLAHRFQNQFHTSNEHISIKAFRDKAIESLKAAIALLNMKYPEVLEERLDGFLYNSLPLIENEQLPDKFHLLFPDLSQRDIEKELALFHSDLSAIISFEDFIQIALLIWARAQQSMATVEDGRQVILDRCRKLGIAHPSPLIFADTNWTGNYFAFLVNPGNEQLELWRTDIHGQSGFPMSSWRQWFKKSQSSWTVYAQPYEYVLG